MTMEWSDIIRMREAVAGYLAAFGWLAASGEPMQSREAMDRAAHELHQFVAEWSKVDGYLSSAWLQENYQMTMDKEQGLPGVVYLLALLSRLSMEHLDTLLEHDPRAVELRPFANDAASCLKDEMFDLELNASAVPGDDDRRAATMLQRWHAGELGDLSVQDVMRLYVFKGLEGDAVLNRFFKVSKLIGYDDEELQKALTDYFDSTYNETDSWVACTLADHVPLADFPDKLKPVRPVFDELAAKGLAEAAGGGYKWKGSAALYGFMVDIVSYAFGLWLSRDRLSWELFGRAFVNGGNLQVAARKTVGNYRALKSDYPTGHKTIVSTLRNQGRDCFSDWDDKIKGA